jgi:predicted transposase/invertase (TIGR01784 family)
MLGKYLNPQNDFAFKQIFGKEKNKDILIHFLNDVLDHSSIGTIKQVFFIPPVQDPELRVKKTSVVDVLCTDEKGYQYIVEMQVAKQSYFIKRAQYYAAKAYSSQLDKGGKYENLKAIIFLGITDFIVFEKKIPYKSDHIILNKNDHSHDLKDFSFTFIELPKFKKCIHELDTMLEKWVFYLKHTPDINSKEHQKLISQNPILKKAYKALDRSNWTEAELRNYNEQEKERMDEYDRIKTATQLGEKRGIQLGEKRGRTKGIEEGEKRVLEALIKQGYLSKEVAEKYLKNKK